jgi:hypothetical protein
MGRMVIACYRPREGKDAELLAATSDHMDVLRDEGLVTDREAIVMKADDGTVIEVFEWASGAAIEAAHTNPRVTALWSRFEACCEYVPIGDVAEASGIFSEFSPLAAD